MAVIRQHTAAERPERLYSIFCIFHSGFLLECALVLAVSCILHAELRWIDIIRLSEIYMVLRLHRKVAKSNFVSDIYSVFCAFYAFMHFIDIGPI